MNCPNCAQPVQGKFCTRCGTRMPESSTPATAQPANASVSSDNEATSRISQADLQDYMARASGQDNSPSYAVDEGPASYGQSSYEQTPYSQIPGYASSTAVAERAPLAVATRAPSSYPVSVTYDQPPSNNRLFAVPIVGLLIRYLMLIPHLLVLTVVGVGIMICQLFLWIPVLFTGQYPEWGYNLVSGTIRWGTRVAAFFYGLTDRYPAFGFGSDDDGYPVQVSFQRQPAYNRFWAIPVLGYFLKYLMLIPHLIILYVLFIIAGILNLVLWIPVLFGGKYPDVGYTMIGGALRWAVRTQSFLLGLTDQYPVFQLAN